MKDYRNRYGVAGTSALKPDCSRYSNENEHIIDFPRVEEKNDLDFDYGKIVHARHATSGVRAGARCRRIASKSQTIRDIRTSNLNGTSFVGFSVWKACVAGGIYSAMALVAIYFSV